MVTIMGFDVYAVPDIGFGNLLSKLRMPSEYSMKISSLAYIPFSFY